MIFDEGLGGNANPWAGLSRPMGFGASPWNPGGQLPWRTPQQPVPGMQPGAPVPPAAAGGGFGFSPDAYLGGGASTGIPGFNPLVAGGGQEVAPIETPAPRASSPGPRYAEPSVRWVREMGSGMDESGQLGGQWEYRAAPARRGWGAGAPGFPTGIPMRFGF